MTADAKVGLLLGLVFIVLIAFLINGLPGFLNPPSKLANAIPQDPQPNMVLNGLAEKAVEAMTPRTTVRESEPSKEERATVTLKGDKPQIQEPAPAPKPADAQPKDSAVSDGQAR